MRYTRISADCHIDMPWLPDDLFTANASAAMKDRMPYVTDGPDGPRWTTKKGAAMGLVGGTGSTGREVHPGQNYRLDVMATTGLFDDAKKGIRRPADPHRRIVEMERDGVDAEVMFGILGAASRLGDHEAANEMMRIYNDWLVEFCKHYPERQIGLANLPYGDIEAAVKEIHRVAKLGLRGARALVLVGHGPDVASDVGAAVASGERGEPAAPLPHVPVVAAGRARPAGRNDPARGVLHERGRVPDEPGEHHRRRHRRGRPRALSQHPHLVRRERHRLDRLRARPHGLRVGGPVPRPRPHDEAERLLAAPVQGDVPVRQASAPSSSTTSASRR